MILFSMTFFFVGFPSDKSFRVSKKKMRIRDFFIGKRYGWKPFYKDLEGKTKLNISIKSLSVAGLATYLSATQVHYGQKLLRKIFNMYSGLENDESVNNGSKINNGSEQTYYNSLDMGSGDYNPFSGDYNLFSKYGYSYKDVKKTLSENTARNNIGDAINAFVGPDGVLKQPEVYWPLTFWIQTKLFMFGEKTRPISLIKKALKLK